MSQPGIRLVVHAESVVDHLCTQVLKGTLPGYQVGQPTGSNGISPHIVQIFLNAEKILFYTELSPITPIASEAAPKEISNACEELLKHHKVTNQQM